MSTAGLGAPAVAPARAGEGGPPTAGTSAYATAAWLGAIPIMAIVMVLALHLGPPLGSLLEADAGTYTFTPDFARVVLPEGTEHARYLIALLVPILMAAATILAPRWVPQLSPTAARRSAIAVQALFVLVIVACYVPQTEATVGGS